MTSNPSNRSRRLLGCGIVIFVLLLLVGIFLATASPIDPLAWSPPEAPALTGPTAPNELLRVAEVLGKGEVHGAEDVAMDALGRIYGGQDDGQIVRLTQKGDVTGSEVEIETIADTGGRPLGLHFDPQGRLVVADAVKGLLRVDVDGDDQGSIEVLATEADGVPFRFTDDLDIASDGRIYFSDASSRWGHHHYKFDLLEARPYGRLLVHDPATAETDVLVEDLYFANGVALSRHEDFVVVNETYRYRMTRYWIDGPSAGTSEIFHDNLPCFADGVSSDRRGNFWVACFTVRNAQADRMHPSPFVKAQVAKLPPILWPQAEPYGLVLMMDEDGRIVRSFHDPGGQVIPQITSAQVELTPEGERVLLLGNLNIDGIGRVPLSALGVSGSDDEGADDAPLVVFLGDSLTAGLGLEEDQAFPHLVAEALRADGQPVRVVNAGVSGDTTAGGLSRLDWLLRQEPDVLVVGLGANDGLRGVDVSSSEQNLRAIIERARERGARVLLLGMLIPPNYGPEYTEQFAAIYPRLAEELDVALVPFLLDGVAGDPALNQADGIHPTAEGQEIVAGNVVAPLAEMLDSLP